MHDVVFNVCRKLFLKFTFHLTEFDVLDHAKKPFLKIKHRKYLWRYFREENPNVSLRLPSALGLTKKNAFHRMHLQRCSVFSISLRSSSASDGKGIPLVELSNLVDSITVGA